MIIIAGHARMDPAQAEAVRPHLAEMQADSRKEPGCLSYDLTPSAADPGFVLILERWKDQAAVDYHFQTPHMAKFVSALAKFSRKVDVKMYDIAQVRDLPGPKQ